MKRLGYQLCVLFLALLSATSAFAQADRATITGTVTDPTGAVVAGATVTAIGVDTGAMFSATSNEVGIYTIPNLPIGTYALEIRRAGFTSFRQTGISLIAAQVAQINVQLKIGSTEESVVVTGTPLLEMETSSESMTMEEKAIRELPINANYGRDALNLMLATVPSVDGSVATSGTQSWYHIAGGEYMSNSVFVDGVDATAGNQGQMPTPGADALQEMQVSSASTDAELGGSMGAAITYELKSGTNKIHGSAFEYAQNTDFNANSWAGNYWLPQCAAGDTTCRVNNSRPVYRFNDYGASAGGPIWKNHTFIFGDFEYYSQINQSLNLSGQTVPTAKMLTGDFSELLTGGTHTGTILQSDGTPWVNPCTGNPYQYGQIFDPVTQQAVQVNGQNVTCATPFGGNVIPSGRLSSVAKSVAGIYSKYYQPTITNRIYANFPTLASGSVPVNNKKTFDIKGDHNFSSKHHLSASYDYVNWMSLGLNGGFGYDKGPFSSWFSSAAPNHSGRVIDNYSITPWLTNTFSIGYARQATTQEPQFSSDPSSYGFQVKSSVFPTISYGNSSNGIGFSSVSTAVAAYYTYNATHTQDTLAWQKGRHSFKFGGTFQTQGMNDAFGGNVLEFNFASDTGGPVDVGLTPFVGSGFASMMLGNVGQSAQEQINQSSYPREKAFALFAVDDFKMNQRLTFNLGLRWDVNLPGHDASGRWENFDFTAHNPSGVWGNSAGAWIFSKGSGTTFYTNNDLHQFGPHLGASYRITDKLVARGSYGIFYVPLGAFSSGYGPAFPANQDPMAFGNSQLINNVEGSVLFNWDQGYPVKTVTPPQDSTATGFGIWNYPMYIHPDILHLGYTHTFNLGGQYEVAKNVLLDVRYQGNRGQNLHDAGRSSYLNYPTWATYQPLYVSGHVWDNVHDQASATAAGVPYPYAGFNGPAYAAISPMPQLAGAYAKALSFGDPASAAVSAYNAFIAELKVRNTHGLYVDYSYTISKETGSQIGMNNFANNWGDGGQNMFELKDAAHWVQSMDQRQLAKGYITYDLPFGKHGLWLNNNQWADYAVGGWTLGFNGAYGSGEPMGPIWSSNSTPGFFGNLRATFAGGAGPYNLPHHFSKKNIDLANLKDAINTDFNSNLFYSAAWNGPSPFGNTPYTFNHWRWNSQPASENLSAVKHFNFGKDGRYSASLRGDFFNVLNRHYFNAPDTYIWDQTFGQVCGVYGNRVGQVSGRVEW